MLDAHGQVNRVSYRSGYTVSKETLVILTGSAYDSVPSMPVGVAVGRWTHPVSGLIYWDEVEVIESLLEAGNVARERGELAIWDNFNNREFFV